LVKAVLRNHPAAVAGKYAHVAELHTTINDSNADVVIACTPSDLSHLMKLNEPMIRAHYEFVEVGGSQLSKVIEKFLSRLGVAKRSGSA
jgi:predicted GTPase